jgi:hypothetical protein
LARNPADRVAIADIGLSYAGIDITGVRWSPLVSGITGGLLMRSFGGDEDEE